MVGASAGNFFEAKLWHVPYRWLVLAMSRRASSPYNRRRGSILLKCLTKPTGALGPRRSSRSYLICGIALPSVRTAYHVSSVGHPGGAALNGAFLFTRGPSATSAQRTPLLQLCCRISGQRRMLPSHAVST